ncbi:DCC1-like thiol-disulfide oxidoreductase family protein [Streptomyces sp. TM32]|uniref:thiol-disulfide oxidoreductase DCC family protein n=1 Tax=Streptomyces sp. TM32 TaxID=1652669 RepID=UPI0020B15E8D|nr:DCC1-like thiol-disulfide oxidoreductase family protein [Streptomyces sp. TM32]
MSEVAGHLADRGGAAVPVRRLTVLYDPKCPLCTRVHDWLVKQRQLVPLELLPVATAETRARFPGLDHEATLREITVIGDSGQVYTGHAAWVVCLWALADYRPMAHRFTSPAGAPLARAAVLAAARYRARTRDPDESPEGLGGCTVTSG